MPTIILTRHNVKMILLWVTLLVLHQGCKCYFILFPVTTVRLGEPATFTCVLHYKETDRPQLDWYKQSAGETLKLIVTKRKSTKPAYAPEFSESRLEIKNDDNFSNLTILRTIQEDEGMYHFLYDAGNTQRTSNYTVVQWPTVSDPVRPGDSVTLQCSVLSDSGNKTCPGDDSVFWFRAGSNKSYPDIIYTEGRRHNECDKRSDTQKSCVYHFSKNISSSDTGTYYCAVATCGEILFGDGTKLQIGRILCSTLEVIFKTSTVCLVISMTGNIVFICYRTSTPVCSQFKAPFNNINTISLLFAAQTEDGLDLNYAALHFSGKKTTRGRKKTELKTEESVYSQVKC
uniref:Ig-like domain-containing protein n=1 Tax=Sander lucioperca TaxID=283035 RepID=A0A8D0AJ71_SANLU